MFAGPVPAGLEAGEEVRTVTQISPAQALDSGHRYTAVTRGAYPPSIHSALNMCLNPVN